jgi:type IV secretion system protein TrbG
MNLLGLLSLSTWLLLIGGTVLHAQAAQSVAAALLAAGAREDPVFAAYLDFERTGRAEVLRPQQESGYVVFPFGHQRPTIRCPRLNACLILLEAGEAMTDQPLAGDTERWIIGTSVMGNGAQSRLVIIKPQFCDIATNLLIPTDRRVYELALVSDTCKARGDTMAYTRQVKFWYPDQMRAERIAAQEKAAGPPPTPLVLNRNYRLDRGGFLNRKRYPWMPTEVFDDGVRTYFVLPEKARTSELPILYLLNGREKQLLNYALRGDTIVADRVLERAVLVVNSGSGERKVEIENRQPSRVENRGK